MIKKQCYWMPSIKVVVLRTRSQVFQTSIKPSNESINDDEDIMNYFG